MLHLVGLAVVGALIGCLGTLIGAGGGFLLAPLLVLLYPNDRPETLAAVSLAVVFVNALSGTVAYARLGRIDYRAGLLFAAAAIPGAVAGSLATAHLSRALFERALGGLLAATAVYLLLRPFPRRAADRRSGDRVPAPAASEVAVARGERAPSFDPALGAALSFGVGFLSSLLGIGGGIIHVPILVTVLGFPVHSATATSHFVLATTALAGTAVHVASGTLAPGLARAAALAAGVVPGAQAGAALSGAVDGQWILRALAAALGFAGLRLLLWAG